MSAGADELIVEAELSTVQRYVEALGGQLTITAAFDDRREVQLRPRAA